MKQTIIISITLLSVLVSCQGKKAKISLDSTTVWYVHDSYIPTDSTQFYFPANFDSFRNKWYSEHLFAMKEPVLFSDSSQTEIYRFVWLRTFHNPISIRIERQQNIYLLTWKLCNGAGGYEPGLLTIAKQKQVDDTTWEKFKTLLNQIDFWSMDTEKIGTGVDGSAWILEGKEGNKYHVIDRWSPEYDKYSQCCNFLIGLTDFTFNEKNSKY